MERVADRLKTALDYRDKSRRWLHKRLEEREVRGHSYASVHSYVRGDPDKRDPEPPLEVVRTAAELLDVRVAWLAFDEGEMTEELEDERRDPLRDELQRLRERSPVLRNLPTGASETFLDLWLAYQRQAPGGGGLREVEGGDEVAMELADDLLFLLTLPLQAWGFEEPIWLAGRAVETMEWPGREPDYTTYFHQQILALSLVIKLRKQGDRLNEWHNSPVPRLRRVAEGEDPEPPEDLKSLFASVQERLDNLQKQRDASADKYFDERRQRVLENVKKGNLILPQAEDWEPHTPTTPEDTDIVGCQVCGAEMQYKDYPRHLETEHPEEEVLIQRKGSAER